MTMPKSLSPEEQANLDERLIDAAKNGHTETVKALLAAGASVHVWNDYALHWAAFRGHTETVKVLAKHIFVPDPWRGKSRAEIEAAATALYNKVKTDNPEPERLRQAGTILIDCALTCWEHVRPAPPKLRISPLPAQPRAL